jgi:hypothetical protein
VKATFGTNAAAGVKHYPWPATSDKCTAAYLSGRQRLALLLDLSRSDGTVSPLAEIDEHLLALLDQLA